MERTSDSPPPSPTPSPEAQQDEDYVFRAQIALTEFGLRYWKYAGYLVGGVLLVAAGWGGYNSYRLGRAEEEFAKISAIDFLMPKIDQMAMYGLGPKDDPNDAARMSDLEEGARRYEAIAKEASGSAATIAWLKAADAWTRAGKKEAAVAANAAAGTTGGGDLTTFVADSVRVGDLVDAGKAADAEALLRDMSGRYSGFFAEEALIQLASLQADQDKLIEAKATYVEITGRFSTSNDLKALTELAARLGQPVPVAPTPAGAPAEAPAPAPAQ
ncbi:hypothetical protein LBMAG42_51880 [Deltaproteobacteria bacterium]|nr:hypothetical protein LBMAG42_51880 [Deltaproteobacteria bacterium]